MCGECQQKDDDQERHYTNELVETFTPTQRCGKSSAGLTVKKKKKVIRTS